ncbi:zf-TFIIB domain-containing protein [Cellulomonas sp. C5510]|uniref:TFIIB-type zinc ribbon-containing protein n=1 Tax=Cellulomonas sp. C5510 TaxID=2871170 RepID=UPI00351D3E0C
MRAYERNGVTIDQCEGCRGVFLDRGELESLIDAEGAFYSSRVSEQARTRPGRGDDSDDYYHGGHGSDHGGRSPRRRRGGFLGDLFD